MLDGDNTRAAGAGSRLVSTTHMMTSPEEKIEQVMLLGVRAR
jgi:hypothetical protein